jgi:hypothetical protein
MIACTLSSWFTPTTARSATLLRVPAKFFQDSRRIRLLWAFFLALSVGPPASCVGSRDGVCGSHCAAFWRQISSKFPGSLVASTYFEVPDFIGSLRRLPPSAITLFAKMPPDSSEPQPHIDKQPGCTRGGDFQGLPTARQQGQGPGTKPVTKPGPTSDAAQLTGALTLALWFFCRWLRPLFAPDSIPVRGCSRIVDKLRRLLCSWIRTLLRSWS